MSRENAAYQANQPFDPMETPRGFVLLVAGVGQGRRKSRALAESEAALAGWVGLPPQILIPDAPADVVQLPAGSGPQTVRGYLERAAVTNGPVLVYLTGHLMPDRRGELHVTLRDSTPSSVRYDGLPWAWLAETLRVRDPRHTLVVVDLTASTGLRAEVAVAPGLLADRLPLWGVLTPPATHDDPAHAFTRTLTATARRGFEGCPALVDPATAHPAVFGRAQLPEGTVQIVPPADTTLRLVNPMPAERAYGSPYGAASHEATGRHRAVPGQAPRISAPSVAKEPLLPIATQMPAPGGPPEQGAPQLHVTLPHLLPRETPAEEQTTGPYLYRERVGELRAAVAAGDFDEALELARAITHDMETRYGLGPEHRDTLDALETWAWLTARAGRTDEAVTLYTETARRSARIHGPGHATTRAAADAAHTLWLDLPDVAHAREQGPAVVALRELVLGSGAHTREAAAAHLESLSAPRPPSDEPLPPPPELRDVLADVAAIAAEGRHDEALGAADAIVDALVADLGWEHVHTLNVREVRAYLTAEAGHLADAVSAYLDIAESRLLVRGREHPDTISAADNAHALWLRMPDADPATIPNGQRLIAVREHIPGPGGRALEGAKARVRALTDPSVGPSEQLPFGLLASPPVGPPVGAPYVPRTGETPMVPEPALFENAGTGDAHVPDLTAVLTPVLAADLRPVPPPPLAPTPAPTPAPGPASAATPTPAAAPARAQIPAPPPTLELNPATAPAPIAAPEPAPEPTPPPVTIPPPPTPPPTAATPTATPPSPKAPSPAPPTAAQPTRNGKTAHAPASTPSASGRPTRPPAQLRAALHAIKDAAAHDNHVEALTLAEELMRGVEAEHGPAHPFTLNAYEVRAHLTASAGLFATAARQYTTLAHRLAEAGNPDDPAACSAADAAQTLWLRLGRTEAARNLGPGIVDLRRRVPGPDGTALMAARDHLSGLTSEPRP